MERARFTTTAPGRLVSIPKLSEEAWPAGFEGLAFVPNPLPPDIETPRSLLIATDATRGALSRLAGEARVIKNADLILGPLSRREAVLSSRIEGTHT
ncbi:MAG: Fic/DOC family N-terminal domain-containing protein, partial [Tepidiformaceae bacterium]